MSEPEKERGMWIVFAVAVLLILCGPVALIWQIVEKDDNLWNSTVYYHRVLYSDSARTDTSGVDTVFVKTEAVFMEMWNRLCEAEEKIVSLEAQIDSLKAVIMGEVAIRENNDIAIWQRIDLPDSTVFGRPHDNWVYRQPAIARLEMENE